MEPINFSFSKIQDAIAVPMDLVQVNAQENEVRSRINRFLQSKRLENDENNIIDYNIKENFDHRDGPLKYCISKDTCARVNRAIVKQQGSQCHLKVFRVKNITGPQTIPNYIKALNKLMQKKFLAAEKTGKNNNLSTPAHKRLEAIEQHCLYTPNDSLPLNVRLRKVEDRILRLESVSPEYHHFNTDANGSLKGARSTPDKIMAKTNYLFKSLNHKHYTKEEVNNLLQHTENFKDSFKIN